MLQYAVIGVGTLGKALINRLMTKPSIEVFAIDNDINDCLENFLDEFSLDRDKLLGVGITLPAIINNKTGTIENAPVLGIKNIPISQITQGIKYPSYVLNDANAGGYAECFFQKQNKSIAYLFIGKGVGGAIIIDSKAYEGQNLRSAEFGHMCIKPNGNKCACGKLGCLEAYCSTARLCDDLNINIDDFFHELSKGNTEYEKIFDEYLNNLARGINTIRMVLDCDIVIGGSITAEIAEYLDKLKEKVQNLNPFGEECDYIAQSHRTDIFSAKIRIFTRKTRPSPLFATARAANATALYVRPAPPRRYCDCGSPAAPYFMKTK